MFATAAGVVMLYSAPALAQTPASPPNDDPWEHFNRKLYGFNEGLDRIIIRPAAMTYAHVLPNPVRSHIRNLLDNANEPPIIANDILQGRFTRAGKAMGRFLLNTVAGLGGIFDFATEAGLEYESTSFPVTLGRWGVGPGPYLYLPVVGPSTVRGVVGTAIGATLDPLYWINYPNKTAVSIGRTLITGLDLRAESDADLKSLVADATDPYATIRSAYLQNLQSQITGGNVPVQSLPEFDDTSPAPPTTTAPANPPGGDATQPAPQPSQEPPATPPNTEAAQSDATPAATDQPAQTAEGPHFEQDDGATSDLTP
jgi:phospholipid-binding lipoprotein MlaA